MQGPILEAKERNGLSRRPIRERLFQLPVLQTVINGHNRGANRDMEAQEELLILALEEAWSSKIFREKICMGIQELGGSYGERGSPAPPPLEAGQGDPPALRLRAPRPKPPPHCPRGFQSGARLPQGQKLAPAAPYLGSGQFRRAWSGEFADSGQSTRTGSEGRGRRTKAQREGLRYRKRLRRLHSTAEQAVGAGAQLGRAAGPEWVRRGRVFAVRLGRPLRSGFINRLEGGGQARLTTHSFPRKFPLTYGPKCGALAFSQVLLSGNAIRELGPSQLQGPGNGCFSPFRETPS